MPQSQYLAIVFFKSPAGGQSPSVDHCQASTCITPFTGDLKKAMARY